MRNSEFDINLFATFKVIIKNLAYFLWTRCSGVTEPFRLKRTTCYRCFCSMHSTLLVYYQVLCYLQASIHIDLCWKIVLHAASEGVIIIKRFVLCPRLSYAFSCRRTSLCLQLKELNHYNVVSFIGACVEAGHICYLMQWCSRGTLEVSL